MNKYRIKKNSNHNININLFYCYIMLLRSYPNNLNIESRYKKTEEFYLKNP